MNALKTRSRSTSRVALFAVAALIGGLVSVLVPSHASAAARLSVSSELGGVTAATDGNTRFDLQGSGYQVIPGGFGGVYVAFGWVNERTWRPSQGGMTGTDYRYVPDSESVNNQGYLGFVANPGSSTEGEAQAVMSDNGSWRLSLNVPGARFTSQDRSGNNVQVDCTQVTCGFLTFGAHGVKNANNETFVPVTFQAGGGGDSGGGVADRDGETAAGGGESAGAGAPVARGAAERPRATPGQARTRDAVHQQSSSRGGGSAAASADGGDSGSDAANDDDDGDSAAATSGGGSATGAIELTVDRAAARPGGALAYTAYGFWPGEQATVSLGQGIAAVGPLNTGVDGEIAGVITLPDDIDGGTYELRAVGAGSGLEGSVRFAISDVSLVSADGGVTNSVRWEWFFLSLAGLLFLAAIGFVVARRIATRSEDEIDDAEGPDHPDGEYPTETSEYIDGVEDFYGTHSHYPAHSGH